MTERSWKWFKNGYQFDVATKAISAIGRKTDPAITVFCETKDKAEARLAAIDELSKYGYTSIEVTKVIGRF